MLIDGVEVGVVTSGNFSPMLGHGIALAFVASDVDVRPGRRDRGRPAGSYVGGDQVTTTPFVHAGQWAGTP